ncbi:glycoside hydrolase family 20 zincin-like fold domain-containing protein, partial [Streptomyces sp. NPDC005245]
MDMELIPAPVSVGDQGRCGFLMDRATTITGQDGTESTERWLRSTLGAAFGLSLPPGAESKDNTILLRID